MSTTWSAIGSRSSRAVCTTLAESAPSAPARASGTAAFATAVAGNTVTVNGMTFTATASGGDNTAQNFAVGSGGGADTTTGDNFASAVNRYTPVIGVSAVNAAGTVTLTASGYGTAGNGITLTKVGTPVTVSGATLSGGVGYAGSWLDGVGAFAVYAEADAAQTIATAVTLSAYVINPYTLRVSRAPTWDLVGSTTGGRSEYMGGFTVESPTGYAVLVPTAGSVSSGGLTVDIICTAPNGELI